MVTRLRPRANRRYNSTSLTETDATQHASFSRPDAPPVQIPSPPVNGDRVLDRLPIGVIVHRGERLLFANRLLLDLVDYDDIGQIASEGGIVRLFRGSPTLLRSDEGGAPLALSTRHSESIAVEVRLATVEWDGLPASLMLIRKIPEADTTYRLRGTEADLRQREARVAELESILDTATDGVIVIDETGRILSLNRSAEALFGYDEREVVGDAVTVLFAPESHIVALDYLEGLRSSGVASLFNDGREVQGRVRQGGFIPLFMTMGYVNDGPDRKFCAVLRDITAFKKAEGELDRGQARGGGGELAEIRPPRQDQPRDPHAPQRHHRLCRSDARGAVRAGRQRALQGLPQGRPRLGRACHQPRQRPPRSRQDRGGADGIVLHAASA